MDRDSPLILAYHDVVEHRPTRYEVTRAALERQLGWLLERGFVPTGLEHAVATWTGAAERPNDPRRFTVTFDDGLASVRTLAVDVLDRLGLLQSTTVFLPTAFVGRQNTWADDHLAVTDLLSWEEVAELATRGISFQSHGHRHLSARGLSREAALADAAVSRSALVERGLAPQYFSFPFGRFSSDAKEAVREAGFDAAFTVEKGGRDRYEMRRIAMYGTDAWPMFRLKVSGRYYAVRDPLARLAGRAD